jgi:methionine-rich copper-binding protein CopC
MTTATRAPPATLPEPSAQLPTPVGVYDRDVASHAVPVGPCLGPFGPLRHPSDARTLRPMTNRSPGRGRSVTLAAVLLALASALVPAIVLAHAELDTVTPADGSTIDVAPTEIVMTFTQDLDASRSSIVLVLGGAEVASGGAVDASAPRQMTLALPALEPGAYEIRWTTFSAEDSEIDRGVTTFTLTPPPPTPAPTPTLAPSATPAPTPSPTASPSTTPAPSPSGSGTPTSSTTDILIPIIAAVILVGGLGYWLMRRRSGASGTP